MHIELQWFYFPPNFIWKVKSNPCQDWEPTSVARADDSQESQDAIADCDTVDPTSSNQPVEPTNPSQQLADDTLEYQMNQIYDSLPEHPLPPVPVPQILGVPARVKDTPGLCKDPPAAQVNPVPTPCRADTPPPETAKKVDAPLRSLAVHEATNGMMFIYIYMILFRTS